MSVRKHDNKKSRKKDRLGNLPFFKAMSDEDQKAFLEHVTYKSYLKRTYIYHQNDNAVSFSILLKGWIKLYNTTVDGKEIVAQLLTTGDILDEGAVVGNRVCFFSAEAADDDVMLASVPSAIVVKMIKVSPAFAMQVMGSMANKIKNLQIENGNLANMDTPQRLSCLLLRLSSWMTGKGGTFLLPYGKSLMAAQLGMEPATFSRTLEKLKVNGVTHSGAEIHIKDFVFLSEHCCTECPIPKEQCAGRRIPDKTEKS